MAKSVLQDWVMELPLREQGTLLTGVRGCDLTPKFPLDSMERRLVGAIRAAFLNPADPRDVDKEPGCFFISEPPNLAEFKPSSFGHYPFHWVMHIVHMVEVLGYRHPDTYRRVKWYALYKKFVESFHLKPESFNEMVARLGEDRIAKGTVVS